MKELQDHDSVSKRGAWYELTSANIGFIPQSECFVLKVGGLSNEGEPAYPRGSREQSIMEPGPKSHNR